MTCSMCRYGNPVPNNGDPNVKTECLYPHTVYSYILSKEDYEGPKKWNDDSCGNFKKLSNYND